ncbi:MAG: GntR family transcriptional regulator, partial [Planctomycetota bacterium]|nr:GntR family transcriptional regulator [Planctomycetota bacterium]
MVETPVDIGLVPRRPREQALHQLRAWMAEGVWPPGMALPSERDLAQHLGLPRHQVRLALEDLTGQGFLVGQGRQRRVARPPAASTSLTSGALAIVCDQREPLPEGGAGASAGLVAGALAAAEAWSEANGGPVILLKRPISAAAVRELALSGLAGA